MNRFAGRRRLWFVPLILAGLALLVLITMLLWNDLMAGIFKLPLITYWQAAGLLILTRLLFGFGGHMGRHSSYRYRYMRENMREKWDKMTPEEREHFREHWHSHCGHPHRHHWKQKEEEQGA